MQNTQDVVIQDVWGKSGRLSKIQVTHPQGKSTFEYSDDSERVDQLRNAKKFAQKQIDAGNGGNIVDKTEEPISPAKQIRNKI